MIGMANGARFVKGSIAIPSTGYNPLYTIDFGATFDEYLFYIEMDETAKTQLMNSGQTGDRQYALLYKYQTPVIGGAPDSQYMFSFRIKPATAVFSALATNVEILQNISSSSLDIWVRIIGNTYAFYPGYTYNYYVVEIK